VRGEGTRDNLLPHSSDIDVAQQPCNIVLGMQGEPFTGSWSLIDAMGRSHEDLLLKESLSTF